MAVRGFTFILSLLAILSGITFTVMGWRQALRDTTTPTVKHFTASRPPPSPARCAECHAEQVRSLAQAPHSLTLQSGRDRELQTLLSGLTYRDTTTNEITDRFTVLEGQLVRQSVKLKDPVNIDWVLGSGHHARTPISIDSQGSAGTAVIEHRLSWYPEVGLDLTLGATDDKTSLAGWHGVGKRLNEVDSRDCLGCHSTWLPIHEGQINTARIIPGVQCSRCHLHGEAHMDAVNAAATHDPMENWADLSPLDSIRRCGECHRRDDHLTHLELQPTNPTLIRFAPVGLSQSRCFTEQGSIQIDNGAGRMDCLTCHNPHQPAETDANYYVARCNQCHGNLPGQAHACRSRANDGRCLECHMPKVEVQKHLPFTDHWIRIREPAPPAPTTAP